MLEKMTNLIKKTPLVIPSYLLENYVSLGITNDQLIMLIYLINNKTTLYNPKEISLALSWSLEEVLTIIQKLVEMEFLSIEIKKNKDITEEHLDIDKLYDRLSFSLINEENKEYNNNIFDCFEKEFGRTLSPIEYELINGWKENNISEELILLALKEAIYNGVNNFRYIDKILYEWGRKGLKNKEDIEKDRQKYHKNKMTKKDVFEYDWLNDKD